MDARFWIAILSVNIANFLTILLSMCGMDQRRRQILRLIGASGLAAIAGCSDSDTEDPNSATPGTSGVESATDTNPSGNSTSDTATPTSGSTSYQEWLVAPSVFPNRDHYFFRSIDYEQVRSVRSELDDDVFSTFQAAVEMEDYAEFDLDVQDVSEVIKLLPMIESGTGGWNVILGEFSKNNVEDAFTDSLDVSDLDETTSAGGHSDSVSAEQRQAYTLYFGGELSRTVALSDGVILIGTNQEMDSTANVRSLIDAKTGETARYSTQNENMEIVGNELGDATFVGGVTYDEITETDIQSGLFEGQVGYGYADTLRGDILETKEVFVFDERASVDMGVIDEKYTEIDMYRGFSSISASRDGRAVLVTGEVAAADLYG